MKKINLIMPILATTGIAGMIVPLASCSCNPGGENPGTVVTKEKFDEVVAETLATFNASHLSFGKDEVTQKETDLIDGTIETKKAGLIVEDVNTDGSRALLMENNSETSTIKNGGEHIDAAYEIISFKEKLDTKSEAVGEFWDCETYFKAKVTYKESGATAKSYRILEFYKSGDFTGLLKSTETMRPDDNGVNHSKKEYVYSVKPHIVNYFYINNDLGWSDVSVYLIAETEYTFEITIDSTYRNNTIELYFQDSKYSPTTTYDLKDIKITNNGEEFTGWTYSDNRIKFDNALKDNNTYILKFKLAETEGKLCYLHATKQS